MATTNRDFRVKSGIVVEGSTATVNGSNVLTTASSLDSLGDVILTTPANNDILKFNGSNWINSASGGGGGASTLDDLTDVVITTPATNSFLQYSGTEWIDSGQTLTLSGNTTIGTSTHTVAFATSGNTSVTLPTSGTLLTTAGSGSSLTFGTGSLTLGGNFTTSGAFTTTLTVTANTSVTLPTSGTLVNSSVSTLSSLSSIGTITTGTWNGTAITATYGGTGQSGANPFTQWGIVYASSATALAETAAGSSGQILRSGGAGAPTWSTATFPNTATTSGTILRADGTNWVASTATFPNTATTSGTFLRADGTNWVASSQTLTLSGNTTIGSSTHTVSFATSGNTSVTLPTTGTLTTLDGSETFTNKTLTTPTIDSISASAVSTAATLYSNITTGSVSLGSGLTTGTITIGSTSWTANTGGAVNVLQATKSPTFTTNAYTLIIGDAGKMLLASNSTTAGTVNIPTNAVAFLIGTQVHIVQTGTGQLTITATTPATTTILSNAATAASPKLRTQYSSATLIKTATDTWYVMGDIV